MTRVLPAAPPLFDAADQEAPEVPPKRRRPDWRGRRVRVTGAVVVLVVVLLAGLTLRRLSDHGPAPITSADVDRAVKQGIDAAAQQARQAPPDAATAFRTILPSVVTITTKTELGTGVVVNADGSVMTARHVITSPGPITVVFADGTKATATVRSQQPADDIAVLAVSKLPQVVVPAVLSGGAQVGDAVFPVGNPLGLEDSLSAGVVSGLERTIRSQDGRTTLRGLIQFDAAVNPGNSGGPLLDRDGHVLGIVTGLANPSKQGYFVGIGFAVPIETAGGAAGGPRK